MNDRLAELLEDDKAGSPHEATGMSETKATKTKLMPKMLNRARKRARLSRRSGSGRKDNTWDPCEPKHNMKEFFDCVEVVSKQIAAVSGAADQIAVLKDRAILASSEAEELKISNDIRRLVEDVNKQARKCKGSLDSLREETARLKQEKCANQTDLRVRDNLVTTLSRKFQDETKRSEIAQEQYKADLKKKVKHQVQLIMPDATDREVDQVMRSGGREEMYQQLILDGGVNHQIKTECEAVAGKYQVVVELERSVAELHQMFLDLALVTEEQGELLDHVEYQLGSANDHIEGGNEEIHEALLIQKKLRKKRRLVLLIMAGVLVVVVLILVPF